MNRLLKSVLSTCSLSAFVAFLVSVTFNSHLSAGYVDFELPGYSPSSPQSKHLSEDDVKESLVSPKNECFPWLHGSPSYGIKALAQACPELEKVFKKIISPALKNGEVLNSRNQYMALFATFIQEWVVASRFQLSPLALPMEGELKDIATYNPKRQWTTGWSEVIGTVGGRLGPNFDDYRRNRKRAFESAAQRRVSKIFDPVGPEVRDKLVHTLAEAKRDQFSTPELAGELLFKLGIAELRPKTIKVKKLSSGFNSESIYKVTGELKEGEGSRAYVLKYLTKGALVGKRRVNGEVYNLQRLRELKNGGNGINIKGINLILPLRSIRYTVKGGETKKLIIMPAAEGKSLTDIVKDRKHGEFSEIREIFRVVGEKLGNFHDGNMTFPKSFKAPIDRFNEATTLVHGDFHSDNVLYKKETGEVSLIDAETAASSLKEDGSPTASLVVDLFYFIQQKHRFVGLSSDERNQLYVHFIKGYISGFSPKDQGSLRLYLESCFRHTDEAYFQDLFRKISILKKTFTLAITKDLSSKGCQSIVKSILGHLSGTSPSKG